MHHRPPRPHPVRRSLFRRGSADHKEPAEPPPTRLSTGPALPLSRLPEPTSTAPADTVPEADRAAGADQPGLAAREASGEGQHAQPTPRRTAAAQLRKATPPRRPMRPAPRHKAKARPSTHASAPRRPVRPTPGPGAGAADMADLCRAAHGVTSPAVTTLCHQTCD
ncbi:hypothetical protein J7E99_22025 [Streptomyces sp. ISL-44]|uniref:hypothetical protein n=1 Tax=Streptomyces sp. ISL-44 TaxID=2819184 RepID=UPI001BE6AB4E|nr:hypothetical protein [Streptomyces sp. ISL-44]MBT2543300.1 hypothetical protein [Streptomyces sp. ISL-44]